MKRIFILAIMALAAFASIAAHGADHLAVPPYDNYVQQTFQTFLPNEVKHPKCERDDNIQPNGLGRIVMTTETVKGENDQNVEVETCAKDGEHILPQTSIAVFEKANQVNCDDGEARTRDKVKGMLYKCARIFGGNFDAAWFSAPYGVAHIVAKAPVAGEYFHTVTENSIDFPFRWLFAPPDKD